MTRPAHAGNGILLPPVTPRTMTGWIVGGTPSLPLEEFTPDRFSRGCRQ
jgi:glycine/D-amino acid oxidase-like deaminating enzyme